MQIAGELFKPFFLGNLLVLVLLSLTPFHFIFSKSYCCMIFSLVAGALLGSKHLWLITMKTAAFGAHYSFSISLNFLKLKQTCSVGFVFSAS